MKVKNKTKISKFSRIGAIFFIAFSLMFLMTGCIGELMEVMCDFFPDSAHCYQGAANQQGNDDGCSKIEAPAQYKSVGSNPPQDKCYLMIAQNTGNTDSCGKIKGGVGSYTQEQCYTDVAKKFTDPDACTKLSGTAQSNCKSALGATITKDKLETAATDLDDAEKALGKDPTDPDLIKRVKDLQSKYNKLEAANPTVASQYAKDKRDEIIGDVDDADVKSDVIRDYTKYRAQNPGASTAKLLDKLQEIKDQKEMIKRLDDQANTLVDQLKGTASDYADEKKQEAIDAVTEKGWDWVKKNGGDDLKYGLSQLEKAKAGLDKASEAYDKLNKQITKIKGAYDEVKGVYDKVDKYNKLIAQGKITPEHAKVLKGAVILGKGLEYATSYVPVFGSTVSTITKETFETTIKLANKRAERSNSLQKCMDDPEHCDPDNISGY